MGKESGYLFKLHHVCHSQVRLTCRSDATKCGGMEAGKSKEVENWSVSAKYGSFPL